MLLRCPPSMRAPPASAHRHRDFENPLLDRDVSETRVMPPVSTSVPLPLVTRPPEPTIEPVMLAFDPPTVLTVRRWPPLSSVLPIVSDPEETWMIPSPPSTIGSEMVLLHWFRIVVDPVEFNSPRNSCPRGCSRH